MKQLLFLILFFAAIWVNGQSLPDSIQQQVNSIEQEINIVDGDSTDVKLLLDWYLLVSDYDKRAGLEPLLEAAALCEKRMIKTSGKQETHQYDYNDKYGDILDEIGTVYQDLYSYDEALKFHFNALKHRERTNCLRDIFISHNNLANLYDRINEYSLALNYYNRALENKDILSHDNLSYILSNKAGTLSNLNRQNEAIVCYHESLLYAKESHKAEVYSNMSQAYFGINKPDSAFFFSSKALELGHQDPEILASTYLILAFFYQKSKMYSKAILNAKLGLKIALKAGYLQYQENAYDVLHECYKELNKPSKALENYEFYIAIKDSLSVIYESELAYKKNVQYEYEKQALADSLINVNKIALLDQENQQKVQTEKNKTTLAIIVLVAILLLTVLIWNAYRQNKTIARNLEEKNTLMEESLRAKEAFMKEIHHRVKNNMQMVSSVLSLKARESDNQEVKQALEESQARIYSMSLSHQKMYQENNFEEINLSAYIKDIVETLFVSHQDEELAKFNFKAEEIPINIEQAQAVGFIVHELVANSMKHAWTKNSKKQLDITLEKKNDEIQVLYKDNGKGLPKEFSLDKATSMGLKLVKAFTKRQLKGFINFSSEQGCNVHLTFTPR